MLRISKASPLTLVTSDPDRDGGDGEEVRLKPMSHSRHKKVVIHGDDDSRTDVEKVCVECFKFLKALAKDYSEVQERYARISTHYNHTYKSKHHVGFL